MKSTPVVIAFLSLAAVFLLLAGCISQSHLACTEEAKLCPDGSAVGRVLPDCEFAPCPGAPNCTNFSVGACPAGCEVCPPCAACSSISCHSGDFCRANGFSENWYDSVNPDCACPQGYVKDGAVCNPRCYYGTPKCLTPSIHCVKS